MNKFIASNFNEMLTIITHSFRIIIDLYLNYYFKFQTYLNRSHALYSNQSYLLLTYAHSKLQLVTLLLSSFTSTSVNTTIAK